MIETYFAADTLGTPGALLTAFVIGLLFGAVLEQTGFGSSRRLAGVFYLTDLAVIKTMFTAMVVALLGLRYLMAWGWLDLSALYLMPTVWGAAVVGGVLFGLGFVMGGWCPGTAAVGAAAGKLDAWVFLGGVLAGSVLFNEFFAWLEPLYTWGDVGVRFVYDSLGLTPAGFILAFTAMAAVCFWVVEFLGWRQGDAGEVFAQPPFAAFTLTFLVLALGLTLLPPQAFTSPAGSARPGDRELLSQIEAAADHVEPEDLADRLLRREAGLIVVDVRPPEEFAAFHLRGAVNITLPDLPAALESHKNLGTIVLYSNGMTHPAQARDALARRGYTNVFILTDGLLGFQERILKPASLRSEPVPPVTAARIALWRTFFLPGPKPAS